MQNKKTLTKAIDHSTSNSLSSKRVDFKWDVSIEGSGQRKRYLKSIRKSEEAKCKTQ